MERGASPRKRRGFFLWKDVAKKGAKKCENGVQKQYRHAIIGKTRGVIDHG